MSSPLLPVVASPGNNLNSYLAYIKKIDILSALEEQKLALRWHQEQDIQAAQALVIAHLRFVVYIARSYSGYGLPMSDIIQEGNIGLMKAVKRFDPHKGVRLITFAVYWIKSEIHRYILQNWRIVRVATTRAQKKLFFNLRQNHKELAWLNEKELKAIAADLQVDKKDVREMETRLLSGDASFESGAADSDDEPSPANYLTDNSMSPELLTEKSEREERLRLALMNALSELDTKSRSIVEARWLAPHKQTLAEIADTMGISGERVRQLEQEAFEKVREHLKLLQND